MYGLNDYRDALGVRRFGISDLGLLSYGTKNDLELPEGWEKRFEGVGGVELKFLDEKLSLIEITYDRSTKWADVDEFAAAIAEGLKLPTGGWRGRAGSAELDCSGFQVRAEILLSPQVTITATGLHEEIERRKAEAEKAKRKVFKP